MFNHITTISPERVQKAVRYLDDNVEHLLQHDVSNYAPGRARIWFPYEAPLSDNQTFKLGIPDQKLWTFVKNICATFGWEPEAALVSKGGEISAHRDAAYADFRSIGINLGSVTWCYERIYPNFGWARPEECINPSEIIKTPMTGGEVFEFNCKNPHWTEDVDPNRWAINAWRISSKKRKEFNDFVNSLTVYTKE